VDEAREVEVMGSIYPRRRLPGEEEQFDGTGRVAKKKWRDRQWNLAKTKGFFMQHDRDHGTIYNDCDSWTFGGEVIGMLGPEQHVSYLGTRISPMSIFHLKDLPPTIDNWLNNIRDAPIRATTRAALIKQHLIPRLLHQLVHSDTPQNQLHQIDQTVKMAVKRALHLPAQTPDGFLDNKTRDGGIGIINLSQAIPRIRAAKDWALVHSPTG